MSSSGLSQLLTPEGMALLDSLPEYTEEGSLALSARLRGEGYSAELVAAALTQSRLRAKAREKFGDFAGSMLFTAHGLEQATRLEVAAHHAARFRDAGVQSVADLGCGLGGDTIAKAGLGLGVLGVECDEETAAFATVNVRPFPNARIELGRAEDFDFSRVDAAWFDPARRETRRGRTARMHDPEEAAPPLSFVRAAAEQIGAVGAKLAPAIDHEHLVEGTETQWVSWRGQVLEACMYFGPLARRVGDGKLAVPGEATVGPSGALPEGAVITRSTLVLGSDGGPAQLVPDSCDEAELRNPPVGEVGAFLWEPDGAVIRSGLLGTLARKLGAHTIEESIAYLSSDVASEAALSSPLARAFRVREVMPFTVKKIAARLRELEVGTLEVKKRGMDIDPARLRKDLKLDRRAPGSATLIATRAGGQRVAIIAEPC
ncbi:class I SAM-dependent methyltransferase [Dermabacter sp. HSID17554]|uniref:class I SAM-dependent methyltransferase n=1 Tax=Dermabacter sp. HSID17554 TaxID=2419511 RepID=UPI000F87487C|nr:class I SAM-dependent methyltransferase [Dermabacter sp. HSID17554]RUP85837.1 class I SAM-dependent methyltransferase [Dermabacter sp. HSID17554]